MDLAVRTVLRCVGPPTNWRVTIFRERKDRGALFRVLSADGAVLLWPWLRSEPLRLSLRSYASRSEAATHAHPVFGRMLVNWIGSGLSLIAVST